METNVVFGLPVDWVDDENRKIFPVAALVVVKGVDSDGFEVFAVMPTEGLSEVDALGMAHFAVLHAENEVRKTLYDPD